jgi:predicted phage baseplate assembly protein
MSGALPAPRLDDRRFQDFVDEAKRLVQRRCPEWTDHNVSDPGVTLIEAFAQMADQLVYRLNRVPDRNYVKFLELLGLDLRSPSAARGEVTFWLSAPQPQVVLVRADTEVATPRTDVEDPVVFSTTEELRIVPCSATAAGSMPAGQEPADHTREVEYGGGFGCFSARPDVGDSLLVGLSDAVPSCAVLLRLDCTVRGVGVDPRRPPLVWEAWTPAGWTACELERDETGGLNRAGDVVLHVPREHVASVLARQRAGWLRCRVVDAEAGQPAYTASPLVRRISAFTIGGTARMAHAGVVREEDVGVSDGSTGQRFNLQRRPVVPGDVPEVLRVSGPDGWTDWARVDSFASSGPEDRHFRLLATTGEVELGPSVREPDGALRQYGAVPPKGARLRMAAYRTGGGPHGNVTRGQVRVLKTSVPYVSRVENRHAAVGGVPGETVEDAKLRAPILLRSRDRAVTREDYEYLAREAAPDAARVQCMAADAGPDAFGVRLVVVPQVESDEMGRVAPASLRPEDPRMLQSIRTHLEERRLIGTRLLVQWAGFRAATAVVSVSARPGYDPQDVQWTVLHTLYAHLHPVTGGPDRKGWPLGRALHAREVIGAIAAVAGVDLAQEVDVQLFPADPSTGLRGAPVDRLDLAPDQIVLSYDHQVRMRP